jgi:hypothetical protein
MRLARREFLLRFAGSLPVVLAGPPRTVFSGLFPAGDSGSSISSRPDLNRFGGLPLSVGQPTGFFRVEKVANRWILVDPEGHPFWMLSVDAVDWNVGGKVGVEAAKAKYGEKGLGPKFGEHAVNRLRSWGFNSLGPYAATYALPVPMYGSWLGCPVKIPFIRTIRPSYYSTIPRDNVLAEPVKVLISGALDPRVYQGWPGHFPDVFDPKFAEAAKRYAGEVYEGQAKKATFTKRGVRGGLPHPSLADEPWLLATMLDESDTIFGFGPGPEIPTVDGKLHPHLGWVAAVTKPTQTENDAVAANYGTPLKVQYSDPVVYTKVAWRDHLKQKYGEIGTLNRVCGSHYTTFDSDGGWPEGHGLMDESGRNAWIGADGERLSTARPAVREDLDTFLGILAERYYQVTAGAVRAATPHHLVITSTNNHGGLIRRPILRAAGKYCDLIELTLAAQLPEVARITYEETRRPLVGFVLETANKDSCFSSHPRLTVFDFPTQEKRAEAYRQELDFLYAFQASDGTHPVVGIELWDYIDKWAEQANSGLVTARDNAYDGKEDVVAGGTDPWGYPSGGEERDYGDFITGVREANFAVLDRLKQDLSRR